MKIKNIFLKKRNDNFFKNQCVKNPFKVRVLDHSFLQKKKTNSILVNLCKENAQTIGKYFVMKLVHKHGEQHKQSYSRYRVFGFAFFGLILSFMVTLSIPNCASDSNNEKYSIPFSLYQKRDISSAGLNLVSTASNIVVSMAGCASGNAVNPTMIATSGSNMSFVYAGDKNCLVKLEGFQYGSNNYYVTGINAVPFTTWLPGDVAVFQNPLNPGDLIGVSVLRQLTQSGTLVSDQVSYTVQEVGTAATQNLAQTSITYGGALSVAGQNAPSFTYNASSIISYNVGGSANVYITLQCSVALAGSNPYTCNGMPVNGTGALNYMIVPAASQATLTLAEADSIYSTNSSLNHSASVAGNIIAPGGTDGHGHTLTNGGFVTATGAGSQFISTVSSISTNNLFIYLVRGTDSTGAFPSYLYFYVTFTSGTVATSACGTSFAGGTGTASNPYQVNTRTYLQNTALCTSSTTYFVQTADIDLGGSGTPWTPIQLYGQYNAKNYTITGLYINNTSGTGANVGLFSTINAGASISNCNVSGVSVTGVGLNMGALAGSVSGTVTNCTSSGTVATGSAITQNVIMGGLVGTLASGGTISSSRSTATVTWGATSTTGTTVDIGGLVGDSSGTSITSSSYTGTITATERLGTFVRNAVGGLVGAVLAGTVQYSYAKPTMSVNPATSLGNQYIGGLVGFSAAGLTLSQNFATGAITVTRASNAAVYYIGGLVGQSGASSTLSNSYTMVAMTVTTAVAGDFYGGFVGSAATVSNSYSANPSMTTTNGVGFADAITTCTNCYLYANATVPAQTLTGLTSYTTSTQMVVSSNFTGFDFTTTPIWDLPHNTNLLSPNNLLSPILEWQCGINGQACDENGSLIANGSFEYGTYPGGNQIQYDPGDTRLFNWTSGGDGVNWQIWMQATDGTFTIDLNDVSIGSLSQVLATTVGRTYTIYFDMAGNAAGNPNVKTMTVTAANDSQSYSFDTTYTTTNNMGYITKSFTFTAIATTTTLTFTSTNGSNYGPVIDNVRE